MLIVSSTMTPLNHRNHSEERRCWFHIPLKESAGWFEDYFGDLLSQMHKYHMIQEEKLCNIIKVKFHIVANKQGQLPPCIANRYLLVCSGRWVNFLGATNFGLRENPNFVTKSLTELCFKGHRHKILTIDVNRTQFLSWALFLPNFM